VYAPKKLKREAELLLRDLLAAGEQASLYIVPDDFTYRLQLALTYSPAAAAAYLEKGVATVPAVVKDGKPVAVGRLPKPEELLAKPAAAVEQPSPPLPPPPAVAGPLEILKVVEDLFGAPAVSYEIPVERGREGVQQLLERNPKEGRRGVSATAAAISGLTPEGEKFLEEVLKRAEERLRAIEGERGERKEERATGEEVKAEGEGIVVVEDVVKQPAAAEVKEKTKRRKRKKA